MKNFEARFGGYYGARIEKTVIKTYKIYLRGGAFAPPRSFLIFFILLCERAFVKNHTCRLPQSCRLPHTWRANSEDRGQT